MKRLSIQLLAGAAFMAAAGITAFGSSHREAPGITEHGRSWTAPTSTCSGATSRDARDYVTLIANYLPLQDAYGGPELLHDGSRSAVYEIHVDNNGDAREDLTFQFRFQTTIQEPRRAGGRGQGRADSAHQHRPDRPEPPATSPT